MLMLLHVCLVAMWVPGDAQPAACLDKDHCPTGFYCNLDVHFCHECLHCASFQRYEPDIPTACVTSVVKCGLCFKGLEEPVDVNAPCVAERAGSGSGAGTPGYVWVFVGLGVPLLVLLVAIIVWWALRNTETFKVIASTRTSVRPARPAVPTAPEQPPPYSAEYVPVRATSPGLPPYETRTEDSEHPFIKRSPSDRCEGSREPADSQAANVYNAPRYVRLPPSQPSAEPVTEGLPSDVTPEGFTVHDEDTMESVWTPAARQDNDTNNNSNDEASSSVSVPAWSTEVGGIAATWQPSRRPSTELTGARHATPAKVLCVRQDPAEERGGSPPPSRRTPRAPAVQQNIVINVTQNNFDADLATTHLR